MRSYSVICDDVAGPGNTAADGVVGAINFDPYTVGGVIVADVVALHLHAGGQGTDINAFLAIA